jgi:hypothetical protein
MGQRVSAEDSGRYSREITRLLTKAASTATLD